MDDTYQDTPILPENAPSEFMPLYESYYKVGRITFMILSIAGLILPIVIDAIFGFPGLMVLVALFIISYLKIRNVETPDAFVYIFILTAPSMINTIFSMFIPAFGAVAGFIGILLSYFILSGRKFL